MKDQQIFIRKRQLDKNIRQINFNTNNNDKKEYEIEII